MFCFVLFCFVLFCFPLLTLFQSNNEIQYLDKKIAGINERREKLSQEYSQLQRVLEHTEAELAKVMGVFSSLPSPLSPLPSPLSPLPSPLSSLPSLLDTLSLPLPLPLPLPLSPLLANFACSGTQWTGGGGELAAEAGGSGCKRDGKN